MQLPATTLPPWANHAPAVVNNGSMGLFQRDIHYTRCDFTLPAWAGAQPVYRPVGQPAKEDSRGAMIFIGGAYNNHTIFGQLPSELARQGWWTNVLPFRDWDRPQDSSTLTGRWSKSRELSSSWERVLRNGTEELISSFALAGPRRPIFLGGFSMGGASAVYNYASLPQGMRELVSGLVLFAPCFDVPKLDDQRNALAAWAIRYLYLGAYLMAVGKDMVKTEAYLHDPELASDVEVQKRRPIAGVHAATSYIRRCREAIAGIEARGGDPKPVLLIHGAKSDKTVLPQSFRRVRRAFPNTREVVLNGGQHQMLVSGRRREAHQAVTAFVSEFPS